jgi:beta-1,4-mannosyl-glycoprotein beta-1,4-N-acetylglucosaminyltransferase
LSSFQNDSSYLEPYRSKLHYVFLDHFPDGGRQDGWIADRYIRGSLGRLGISKLVATLSPTDLILVTDLDEMINRKTIEYLISPTNKFSEPIGMSFEWSIYGYFWKLPRQTKTINGCTLRMLRYAFDYDTQMIRDWEKSKNLPKVKSYLGRGRLHVKTCISLFRRNSFL